MIRILEGIILCAILFAGAACETLGESEQPAETAPGAEADESVETIPYEVVFAGVEDPGLLGILDGTSRLIELQERPPATMARLNQRIEEDLERLKSALHSEGFYDAELTSSVSDDETPVVVTIDVKRGPRYRLDSYEILYEGETPPPEKLRPTLAELGLELDSRARAPTIAGAERLWPTLMRERGYPLAKVLDRKAVINRDSRTMAVTLTVDAGSPANFGAVDISGADEVSETYIRALLPWKEGEVYDSRKLEEMRRSLSGTRLFSSVSVRPGSEVEADGELPVEIQLVEGPPRTIGFGGSYSTDIGFGVEAFWEHRNYFGSGERLRVNLEVAEIEQRAGISLRKPAFRKRDQALLLNASIGNTETDAYDERSLTSFVGVETGILENWRLTAGVAPEFSDIKEDGTRDKFFLIGLPLVGVRDLRNDFLNPTKGTRVDLSLTPYVGTIEDTVTWLTGTAGGSVYYAVDSNERFVLASRGRVGFLVGESNEDVPASKRFYAGGGGSIRGYEFQTVGPLDSDNDPLGGRSLYEFSLELRTRITETIGVVPFVDGGTVFTSSFPDFSETTRFAAGLGLRYFTAIGPLRVDFAFPINKRDRDDSWQFYVSLGQAF